MCCIVCHLLPNIPGPVKHTYTLWFIHSPVLHCMCPYIEAQRVNLQYDNEVSCALYIRSTLQCPICKAYSGELLHTLQGDIQQPLQSLVHKASVGMQLSKTTSYDLTLPVKISRGRVRCTVNTFILTTHRLSLFTCCYSQIDAAESKYSCGVCAGGAVHRMGSPKGARLEKTRVCVFCMLVMPTREGAGVWGQSVCVCVCVCEFAKKGALRQKQCQMGALVLNTYTPLNKECQNCAYLSHCVVFAYKSTEPSKSKSRPISQLCSCAHSHVLAFLRFLTCAEGQLLSRLSHGVFPI